MIIFNQIIIKYMNYLFLKGGNFPVHENQMRMLRQTRRDDVRGSSLWRTFLLTLVS